MPGACVLPASVPVFPNYVQPLQGGHVTKAYPTLETTLGQMTPPESGHPLKMPPESGGIPGRAHFWQVPFALMLSPGWHTTRRGVQPEERASHLWECNPV